MVMKLCFVNGFEYEAQNFLDDPIFYRGNSNRALLGWIFGDVDSSDGLRLITHSFDFR